MDIDCILYRLESGGSSTRGGEERRGQRSRVVHCMGGEWWGRGKRGGEERRGEERRGDNGQGLSTVCRVEYGVWRGRYSV
jgi:hypothetical protein